MNANVLAKAKNTKDVINHILDFKNGRDNFRESRQKFIKEFIRPIDQTKNSGTVAAEYILEILRNS